MEQRLTRADPAEMAVVRVGIQASATMGIPKLKKFPHQTSRTKSESIPAVDFYYLW